MGPLADIGSDESVFATVRHRTVRTKGALSQDTARLAVFKLVMAAAKTSQADVLITPTQPLLAVPRSRAFIDLEGDDGHCHGNWVPDLAVALQEGDTGRMKQPPNPHYRHRFPAEIISYAVWLYHVFSLSLRDVELLLAERRTASYETVRRWCRKFGQSFAQSMRRRRPRPGDKWHRTRYSSGSKECCTISDVRWTRMVLSSISSFSNGAMRGLPSAFSKSC